MDYLYNLPSLVHMTMEIRTTFLQHVSLIDILWSKDIREQFKFLIKNEAILTNTIEDFKFQSKNKKSQYLSELFLLDYGHLRWSSSQDIYIYIRNCKNLLFKNETLRPIISFSPKSRKWKIENFSSKPVNNSISKVNFHISLVAEIAKSFSITTNNLDIENSFIEYLKPIKQVVYNEQVSEKQRILKVFYKIPENHSVRMSNILTVIECSKSDFDKLGIRTDLSSIPRIPKAGWIHHLNETTLVLIYNSSKVSSKFRKRVIRSLTYPFILKCIRNEINFLFDRGIDTKLSFNQKIMFIEYAISVLNPDFYSSKTKRSYLLPLHYQRKLFFYIYDKIGERTMFENILNETLDVLSSWESYELLSLLIKQTMISKLLRQRFKNEKLTLQNPSFSEREIIIITFLKKEFYKQLERDGLSYAIVKDISSYGGRSANYLREHLHKWMKGKYDSALITHTELKVSPIVLLEKMQIKGYLNIKYVEKTKTKLLYSLNLDNKLIQKLIFEGLK